MRFALLAAVSALGLCTSANAATVYYMFQLEADATGVFNTTQPCVPGNPILCPLAIPTTQHLSKVFGGYLDPAALPTSFSFHEGVGQFDPQYDGTLVNLGNGRWTGTNLVYNYRVGVYDNYFLTAATFNVFQLSPAPVPEPSAWALMIAGFGLTGGAMRLRRRSEPATA